MRIKVQPKTVRQSPHGANVRVLAIDPGSKDSAYIIYSTATRRWSKFGKIPNAQLLLLLYRETFDVCACEKIASYGMPVGETIFDTVRFTGRIEQIVRMELQKPLVMIKRQEVKNSLAPLPRRNDKDVRNSLIKLYGEPGTSKRPGVTYGITKDVWAALGVAHAFAQQRKLSENSLH